MPMSPSSFGIPNTQTMSLKLVCKSMSGMPLLPHVTQVGCIPRTRQHVHMMMSARSNKALTSCHAKSSLVKESKPAPSILEDEAEKSSPGPVSKLIPNSEEVKFLLTELCDTTSIAEFELKLNGFHLHVTRSLPAGIDSSPSTLPTLSISASVTSDSAAKVPASSDPTSATSLALVKAGPSEIRVRTLLERAADEGLVIIQSPKVGFFRRCRTIKGKRAPPACKEKQRVKEGQVICFIEQIGWEAPIESDVAGEVTKILCEDGDPVGYGDPIIAILPSFPGIKKLPAEN